MLVKDLIAMLQEMPQDAEICICGRNEPLDGYPLLNVGTKEQLEREGYTFHEGFSVDGLEGDEYVFFVPEAE